MAGRVLRGGRAMPGKRLLSPDEERRLIAQFEVGRNNRPKKLAERFGISVWAVNNYVRRARSLDLISRSDKRSNRSPA